MNNIKPHITMYLALFLMTGCIHDVADRVNPFSLKETPYAQDSAAQDVSKDAYDSIIENGWWVLYDDTELNTIIALAFHNNPDLNQIKARLAQTKASATQTRSSLFPSITASGDRGTQSGDDSSNSDFNLAGAASYELDLWGKNRASYKSDKLNISAGTLDVYTSAISLSASIVENWLDIMSLLEQEALLRKQIDVNETVLSLQKKRFEMGSSTALDILQQEEILASSQALLPDILSNQKQAANNIAVLIGETPYSNLKITAKPFPAALPIPEAGLPSDLMNNRPDIKAAWLRLQSSDWAIKAAWADRLPSFDLTANLSSNVTRLDNIFNAWLLDIALGFTTPIFDGGSKKAEQRRQEALSDESFHAYRGVVLAALVDVENALVQNTYQDQKMAALKKQLNASNRTLEQAQLSYTNGDSDYINVLNSLKNTQSLEQSIVSEKLIQAQNRVSLYRALGGNNWLKKISLTTSQTAIDKIYGKPTL